MSGYNFDRPYVDTASLPLYVTTDENVIRRYGRTVRAIEMSNSEYAFRYNKLRDKHNMKSPPSHIRIFGGYLVVRRLGTPNQYETWMPYEVFNELYKLNT